METGGTRLGFQEAGASRFQLGTNQSGMRAHNERLVLSLVRQHGSLAKSDIARMTMLSAQTVSVIMRELEQDGLLVKEEPIRGKIGQPSIPMSLNPEGAFFLGLKIGRRSAELVLIDFVGTVRGMLHSSYLYPAPKETVAFVRNGIASLRQTLSAEQDRRIAGLGIAMPFELWNWADTVGAPRGAMDQWRSLDIRAEIQTDFAFPIYLQNDATSACGAELVFGRSGNLRDFVYFYIGAFAGGGVVLDGKLYRGPTGNAGALGSMPVIGPDGRPAQLIDVASIAILEKALKAGGRDASHLWTSPEDWGEVGPELDAWIDGSGTALAYAIASASAVIDFEAAVIDGWMPASVRARLVEAVAVALVKIDVEGLDIPRVREGTVGIHARALGGASLPLSERFLLGGAASSRET
ncbi:ROK family transcriptional regulator [Kumtagia ephedrae]|nr:ROK family transcriptional regulator [Mesorhizobium ephedrae]